MYDHKTGKGGGRGAEKRGKKEREWDRTQQVDRIIFGENMKLLMEALEGEYLLTLTAESFVMP